MSHCEIFFVNVFFHVTTMCFSLCSCRINRILESPRGNALLVGVGGSGKQSLARLAAYISSLEVYQITLRKGYGIPDLKVKFNISIIYNNFYFGHLKKKLKVF